MLGSLAKRMGGVDLSTPVRATTTTASTAAGAGAGPAAGETKKDGDGDAVMTDVKVEEGAAGEGGVVSGRSGTQTPVPGQEGGKQGGKGRKKKGRR